MTEWNCMDPDYPDRLCDYEDCEVECPYRKAREKLEAVKTHLTTWVSGHSDWQMGRMSQWKKKLVEILEAED